MALNCETWRRRAVGRTEPAIPRLDHPHRALRLRYGAAPADESALEHLEGLTVSANHYRTAAGSELVRERHGTFSGSRLEVLRLFDRKPELLRQRRDGLDAAEERARDDADRFVRDEQVADRLRLVAASPAERPQAIIPRPLRLRSCVSVSNEQQLHH